MQAKARALREGRALLQFIMEVFLIKKRVSFEKLYIAYSIFAKDV